MWKFITYLILLLVIVLVIIQFIPIDRTNPGITYDIPTSPAVKSVLKKACYDCHSNETVWPWYSKVAPISWFVVQDIKLGREELNYSEWDRYDSEEKIEFIRESWEEVAENEMPLWFYIQMHPEARLTSEDRTVLRNWAAQTFTSGEIPEDYSETEDDD